ncbi:MAG: sigma-54-dependent Fis family transcriptional regulator [Acidobacteria bacterium]|nr:sigma-54-dependent Fis family transcriptional regulator [Acidobacteriota bacterium]
MHEQRPHRGYPSELDRTLIGPGVAMQRLKELISRVAQSRSNVLIQGESGTGKEVVARSIHSLSSRAAMAFIAENCAALPEGVVESELFGHVRGAFTGADRDRPGLIALADGGTLFLDEVGDLPPRIQAKLLRVIQEGEFRPVGGRELRRSDFRVVAATHRDLRAMVERGEFREDLYYRLNVVGLSVPALRERLEDIPHLVEHVLSRLRPAVSKAGVSREAMEMLLRYAWPGNVRELQNVLEGGLVLSGGSILGVAELPERIVDNALAEPDPRDPGDDRESPRERVMIELALTRFQGDKTRAAEYIGWSRPRLYRRMRHHGIAIGFGGSPERKKGAPGGAPFS